jgi:hypothetical protein
MARRLLRIPFLLPFSFFIAGFLISVSIGCGGGSAAGTTPTGLGTPTPPAAAAPAITSIAPSSIPAGSAGFSLQIDGSGFVTGSVASWNGTKLTTTFVSATELMAAVPASLAASGGTFAIAVANPDGQNSGSSNTNANIAVNNPVPVIASLSATSAAAGSGATSVVVTGTGFVQSSVASFAGNARTTTVQSATQLTMALMATDLATAGKANITIANPSPGGGVSAPATFTVTQPPPVNAVPTITSLSPASATAGSGAINVVVTGSSFVQSSVASFAGNARTTTVQSATRLTMALTAADLATAGQVNVTVANPAPGGGVSPPATFTITQAPPMITGVTPASLVVGSPATSVTIMGTGFTADSKVLVDNSAQVPSSVSASTMKVKIPASDLGATNPIQLKVVSGSLFSNIFSLPVVNPMPAIQSLSISTVTAGSPTFSLAIHATGLVSSTQVNVNGEPVSSSSISGSIITVPITANVVAQVGTVSISLTNPAPGGGTSNIATLNVIAGSNYLRAVDLPANALVWNPQQKVIYAAVPASSSSNASSVVAIDPTNGKIVVTQKMPGEPILLAISGDQQYLYVAMPATASIARLKLPTLTPDIQWSVGPLPTSSGARTIFDMHVAPGLPHTIAVAQEQPGNVGLTELAIYDDGVSRPHAESGAAVTTIQWGADASTIYGSENFDSAGWEFTYQINTQGATLATTSYGAFTSFPPHLVYDNTEKRLYDPYGDVVDAATGKSLGRFPVSSSPVNPMSFAVDSSQRRVYFLGTTPYPDGVNSANFETQISVYNQDRFTSEGTIALPSVNSEGGVSFSGGENLIRWGTAGLAFDFGSNIYILDGPFVTPGAVPTSSTGTYATPPPQLTGLSPESVVAGSPDTTITLTGQNLTPATTVTWNNNILTTTFVNNTEVQATIPAAALSAPTAAPLDVENSPGEGIANVLAFSVLPNVGPGMQLTALNLSGSDLAWNASNSVLYVAVTSDDSIHPQSIASVDPVKGTILSTVPASSNLSVLSIAGDDKYLYAGFESYANVQRYALPGLTPDLLIPLGSGDSVLPYAAGSIESCDFAESMAVAPGLDNTIAVTQGHGGGGISPFGCGATVVIDGATPRPVNTSVFTSTARDFSELTWGADATAIYAQGSRDVATAPISALTVSSSGIVFDQSSSGGVNLGYRPHFDAGTGLIYSDGGMVTKPSDLSQVGNFNASGLMVPDSTLGLAYFLGQTPSQGNGAPGTVAFTLQIYDLHSYALLDSIVIPNVIGQPIQMVRWGASGIAFTTENGDFEGNNAPGLTYILSGSEISKPSAAVRQKSAGAEHVRLTWKPGKTMQSGATGRQAAE